MGSPTLFAADAPGVRPADGSRRRWSETLGWVPVHEAMPFDAPGFQGADLFTAIVHLEGRVGFGAFDARSGINLTEDAYPSRPLAVSAARAVLRAHGRDEYEDRVRQRLAQRREGGNGR